MNPQKNRSIDVERLRVLVGLERLGRLARPRRRACRASSGRAARSIAAGRGFHREHEPRGVEDLDREAAPDLHLLVVDRGVVAEARARRPVAHGVGRVPLEHLGRHDHVALGLRHLLAVGVEHEAADRRVRPRQRVVLEVSAQHRVEEPGADDVVGLRAQVHREQPLEQVGVVLPPRGDLRRERRRRPRVHDVGVADEPAGRAALLGRVARAARRPADRSAASPPRRRIGSS